MQTLCPVGSSSCSPTGIMSLQPAERVSMCSSYLPALCRGLMQSGSMQHVRACNEQVPSLYPVTDTAA
jgi:hypothetical protein